MRATRKERMATFRRAQATVQERNALARKHACTERPDIETATPNEAENET